MNFNPSEHGFSSEDGRIQELEKTDTKIYWKIKTLMGLEAKKVKINCHGATAYLSSLDYDTPRGIDPEDMYYMVESLQRVDVPEKGDLALVFAGTRVAHSGIVIDRNSEEAIILHKEGYNQPFKIEPASDAFKNCHIEYRRQKKY